MSGVVYVEPAVNAGTLLHDTVVACLVAVLACDSVVGACGLFAARARITNAAAPESDAAATNSIDALVIVAPASAVNPVNRKNPLLFETPPMNVSLSVLLKAPLRQRPSLALVATEAEIVATVSPL